ncbi:MAG: polysaccharide biosynthesis/export family protein [bacterium]|nr:polysaccharide biosynthesis/export family protein [bacterium]MDD5353579.1 polysaccharide biosynthesis/export family protein [bacterium]
MKKRIFFLIIALTAICHLLSAICLYAEPFTQDHWSARSAGMGNAFTGLAYDPSTIWFNPAGTSMLELSQGRYNILFPYINKENKPSYTAQSLVYVFPYQREFAWGLGWNRYWVKNSYQENTILLNLSGKLNQFIPSINDLYLGTNLKGLFHSTYKSGNDLFDSLSDSSSTKSAFGLDIGACYEVTRDFNLGIAVLNLNRPPLRLTDDSPRLPAQTRIGTSFNINENDLLSFFGINRITPALDLVRKNNDWETNLGAEVSCFDNQLALRSGVNSDEASVGISLAAIKAANYSIGIDYSFVYSYNKDLNDRLHMISLRFTRRTEPTPIEEPVKETRVTPYRFGPDDVIQIITRNHDEFSGTFTIDPYGKIMIQLIGEIELEGLTKKEMTEKLRQEINKYVQDAVVLVTTIKYRSNIIYVLGEVRSPGKYPIQGDFISLRDAIAAAGFPTGLAATWRVYIIKPSTLKPTYRVVNLYNILYLGKLANNVLLTPDDVVYVPATILGKLSYSLSYLLDPFFKARSVVTPLSTTKPLLETATESVDTTN